MAKKISALIFGSLYILLSSGVAWADSRPYFKIYGGDISVGGWFNDRQTTCSNTASTYQAPSYNPLTNKYKGSILAYAKADQQQVAGSTVEYGALALGLIESDTTNFENFDSNNGNRYYQLSFSNTNNLDNRYFGGFFEGNTRQQHCIADYYGTKKQDSAPELLDASNVAGLASGQYKAKSTTVLNVGASGPIVAGKKISIFVDGNVYINSNITYDSRANYTADNVPKFALVVKGAIYIAHGVSQLDGLYIAQVDPDKPNPEINHSGMIWTCYDNPAFADSAPTGVFINTNCRNKLTVNGAFIAKQVNLFRVNGDVSSATLGEAGSSPNIAESFTYTPEMFMGGPFFNPTNTSAPKVQSLISLPPVF